MIGDENSHVDSLGLFLTGASSDGGSQPDPDLSLGNYRSSTRLEQLSFYINNPIRGIKIDRVGGANGTGLGSLEAVSNDSLRWSAPGGLPGTTIAIANGETKLLETAGDYRKYIIVSRNSPAALQGVASVTLVPIYNNVIGSSNVVDAERAAGEVKLRCIAMKSMHALYTIMNLYIWIGTLGNQQVSDGGQLGASGAGTIVTTGSFASWPDTGFCRITQSSGSLREIVYYSQRTATVLTVSAAGRGLLGTSASAGAATDKLDAVPGVKIAKESPVSDQFSVADTENDTSEVSGMSWVTGITKNTGLFLDKLPLNNMIGIWLWMLVIPGQSATPRLENMLNWEFGVYDLWSVDRGILDR